MGIKDIHRFNVTLLAKWKWRLSSKEVGEWKNVIESRYGDWRDMANSTGDRKNSYWWKDLGSICEVHSATNWFDKRISWKHGNGDKIRFWEDWWVGEGKLMDKFPRLYVICLGRGKTINEMRTWNGNSKDFMW